MSQIQIWRRCPLIQSGRVARGTGRAAWRAGTGRAEQGWELPRARHSVDATPMFVVGTAGATPVLQHGGRCRPGR